MPNAFAYLALFGWSLVVLWLLKRYRVQKAILIATVLSELLLPSKLVIDLPLLPPLDKHTVNALSIVLILFISGKRFRLFQPGIATKLLLGYFSVLVVSALLNDEPINFGSMSLPGITLYDAFSGTIRMSLVMMPLMFGRYFFNTVEDNESTFKYLVFTSLLYSLLMLFEVKMSPQLHNWVYGFLPTEFVQQMRGDGFRPIVFIGHGLPLAFWFSTCLLAAMTLHKNKRNTISMPPFAVVMYMFVVLFLCKTWATMIYALLGCILIYNFSPKMQIKISFILIFFVLIYPFSKILGIFPDKELISLVADFNPDRAQSLAFRIDNEDILLEHAMKKPFFGWSIWGRNRVYNAFGYDLSVTDGKWILELGMNGVLGFFIYYSILISPIIMAYKTLSFIDNRMQARYVATLAIILTISIIDSVPNTNMGSIHLLLAGALLGQSESLIRQNKKARVVNNGF